ncbi:hypothetical protein ACVWZA_004017 [Sphingomonas sp. UYAg733]
MERDTEVHAELVDLGVASEETRGIGVTNFELGGYRDLAGISNDD